MGKNSIYSFTVKAVTRNVVTNALVLALYILTESGIDGYDRERSRSPWLV